jgi:hypothetical protein
MDDTVDFMGGSVAVTARRPEQKKKGVGGIAMIGVITVLAIAVVAVLLGFTTGELSVGSLRSRIPFLKNESDGWVKVDDQEGQFTVDMPSNRQADSIEFPGAQNGRLSGWSASIGTETALSVYYGTVTPTAGESAVEALNRTVDVIIYATNIDASSATRVTVVKRTDTDFRGYPAIEYEVKGVNVNGENGYGKAIVFLKGDQLYTIASRSVYQDQPQFDRLANSFVFTG